MTTIKTVRKPTNFSDWLVPDEPIGFVQDWCKWPELPYNDMDGTLNILQYIQQTIRKDPTNIDAILTQPEMPDEGVWKYEHLRQFCMELNGLAVRLQEQCTPATCTQMTATEQWIFLCAAHKSPKEEKTYLCRRFTAYVIKYNLMAQDHLIVPINADGTIGSFEDSCGNPNSIGIVTVAEKAT